MSSETPAPTQRRRPAPRWQKILIRSGIALACVVFVAGATIYATLLFGQVRGEEFAPRTFQRRSFAFYQLPLLGIQVSGIDRSDTTNSVEQKIASQDVLSLPKPRSVDDPNLRWDLISATQAGALQSHGEAQILCRYLDTEDQSGASTWLDWTNDNPELAKVAWGYVHEAAELDLYVLVPALFALAQVAEDEALLETSIQAYLAEKYVWIATAQSKLGNYKRAFDLFSAAIPYAQADLKQEATAGRDSAYEALEESDRVAIDRTMSTRSDSTD